MKGAQDINIHRPQQIFIIQLLVIWICSMWLFLNLTLKVFGNDAELEDCIIQHLAAAAAMGRAYSIARRGGRLRSGSHGQQQYLIFSTNSNAPSVGSTAASSALGRENESAPVIIDINPTSPSSEGISVEITNCLPTQAGQIPLSTSGTSSNPTRLSLSTPRTPAGHSSPVNQERPGPSELQSFSENLKSRLNAVSMRFRSQKRSQCWNCHCVMDDGAFRYKRRKKKIKYYSKCRSRYNHGTKQCGCYRYSSCHSL